jgi:hypothetical protein
MVTIGGDEIKTAIITKANDAAEGVLFSFKSEFHDFGPEDDGDPQTVNIISGEECNSTPAPHRTASQSCPPTGASCSGSWLMPDRQG